MSKNNWIEYTQDGKYFLAHRALSLEVDVKNIAADSNETDIHQEIDDAFFLLSQTRIGRSLLEYAKDKGTKVIVDDKLFLKEDDTTDAFVKENNIHLRSQNTFISLSLTLAHELAHIGQKKYDLLSKPEYCFRLDRAIQLEWATEAEAFATSAQFAVELSMIEPDSPDNSWVTKEAIYELRRRDDIASIVCEVMSETDPEKIFNGHHMATQFSLFYSKPKTREAYAKEMVEHFNFVKSELPFLLNRLSYRDKLGNNLSECFYYLGTPYLSEFIPDIELDTGKNGAMPEVVKDSIVGFYNGLGLAHIFEKAAVKKLKTYKNKDIKPKIVIERKPKKRKKL